MLDFFTEFKEQPTMAWGNLCLTLAMPCFFMIIIGITGLDTTSNHSGTTPTSNISHTTTNHLILYGLIGFLICTLGLAGVIYASQHDKSEQNRER